MKIGAFDVTVRPNAASRSMTLRYSRDTGEFRVTVPMRAKEKDIRDYLTRNLPWMIRQSGSNTPFRATYAPGERHMLSGKRVTLGRDVPAGAAFEKLRREQFARIAMELVRYHAARMGVPVSHVTFRDMNTRWGSWNPKTHRMTLNVRLGKYPPAVAEETVVHELCHHFHADHSAAFYQLLTRQLPDWKKRKAYRDGMDVRPLPPEQP